MALSYGPARGLEYDRRRGFRAWVDCDDRHGRNFCLVRCNAHRRVQAYPAIPRHGVNTVDAPLQERAKSRKNYIVFISVIGNPLKVDILLSRVTFMFLPVEFSKTARSSFIESNEQKNEERAVLLISTDKTPNLHFSTAFE
jgi:hypothetical protein